MQSAAANPPDLVFGWRGIGRAVGKGAHALAAQYSYGTLPVAPLKYGPTVAMTPQMIERLKAAFAA